LVPRYGCQPAKPCRLGTQAGSFSGDQKILSDLRRRICRKHRFITSSADFRSTVIGRCQTNRLTSRFVTTQLQAQCTLRHESRWDVNTQKKESTPDAAHQRLNFSERMWINWRECRRIHPDNLPGGKKKLLV